MQHKYKNFDFMITFKMNPLLGVVSLRGALLTVVSLLTAVVVEAQIPVPSDPVCALCGVDLKSQQPHKRGCIYYEEPADEEEESKPQQTTPKPKDPTKLKEVKPVQEKPARDMRKELIEDYERMYRRGEASYDCLEMVKSEFIPTNYYYTDNKSYELYHVPGKGMGIWCRDYKDEDPLMRKWYYTPHYERIEMTDGGRAAMQLKTTKKWGVENLDTRETMVNFEYDEVRYIETFRKKSAFFLNQKDEMGRDRWFLHDGNDFPLDFPFQYVTVEGNTLTPPRAFAQTIGGEWYYITGFEHVPGNLNINGPFGHIVQNDISHTKHVIASKVDANGHERYGVMNLDGQVIYDFEYDMIERSPSTFSNYCRVWKGGHVGALELQSKTGPDGKTYYRYVESIKPQYDMFKSARAWSSKQSRGYNYCVVGRQDRYALNTGEVDMPIALPTIYTLNEVETFAPRFFTEGSDSKPLKEMVDNDFKQFCEIRAINLYKQVKADALTPGEVEQQMDEGRLVTDYLRNQSIVHQKKLKLGKYDEAKQAFEVHSPWGDVVLSVPKSEAEAVKKAWKDGVIDNTIQPNLQLDQDTYRPVLLGVRALINGKTYGRSR